MLKEKSIRTTVITAVIGAIIGSLLTFTLPILYNYITSNERNIIEITPTELITWYNNIDNDFQATKLAEKIYFGKHIKYSGVIDDMSNFPNGKISIGIENISAWFNENGNASHLNKGDTIYLTGKIRYISHNLVILDKCKLIDKN